MKNKQIIPKTDPLYDKYQFIKKLLRILSNDAYLNKLTYDLIEPVYDLFVDDEFDPHLTDNNYYTFLMTYNNFHKYDAMCISRLQLATDLGNPTAMCCFGSYYNTYVLPQYKYRTNFAKMEYYYEIAMEHGNKDAMFSLGLYYDELRDIENMKRCYLIGVEHNCTLCVYNLTFHYIYDLHDYIEGLKYSYKYLNMPTCTPKDIMDAIENICVCSINLDQITEFINLLSIIKFHKTKIREIMKQFYHYIIKYNKQELITTLLKQPLNETASMSVYFPILLETMYNQSRVRKNFDHFVSLLETPVMQKYGNKWYMWHKTRKMYAKHALCAICCEEHEVIPMDCLQHFFGVADYLLSDVCPICRHPKQGYYLDFYEIEEIN